MNRALRVSMWFAVALAFAVSITAVLFNEGWIAAGLSWMGLVMAFVSLGFAFWAEWTDRHER